VRRGLAAAALAAWIGLAAQAGGQAPPEAAQDARLLVENGIAVARNALRDGDAVFPFAFFMDPDGRVQRLSPKPSQRLPAPEALLDLLERSFRERAEAGECRAVAIVVDVRIALPGGGETDAVQVGVEHRAGHCENIFYPYARTPQGELRFDDPITSRRRGVVFSSCR
jgi:hypothetical protein